MQPTILDSVHARHHLAQEQEILDPVLTVTTFEIVEEAIEIYIEDSDSEEVHVKKISHYRL